MITRLSKNQDWLIKNKASSKDSMHCRYKELPLPLRMRVPPESLILPHRAEIQIALEGCVAVEN